MYVRMLMNNYLFLSITRHINTYNEVADNFLRRYF